MPQPTPYQYVKLGSNLEFLRGIATVSVMQTTSLVAFPGLMENLSAQRYSVVQVVNVMKSLLVQLEEMGLAQSLQVAEAFRPMLAEMEGYLARQAKPELAHLNDPFAERLVVLSKQLGSAVRNELATAPNPSGGEQ
jgi:hypothetical protein